jgi:hypothetical protein
MLFSAQLKKRGVFLENSGKFEEIMEKLGYKKMTHLVMNELVSMGFLCPLNTRKHLMQIDEGTFKVDLVNETNEYGGHKVIAVGINVPWPMGFHYHPSKEEVFLFSSLPSKPLYIAFARASLAVFKEKVKSAKLTPDDFLVIEMRYNDPDLSAFIVNENVLHGEFTTHGNQPNPMIYVTEPASMATNEVNIGTIKSFFSDLRELF